MIRAHFAASIFLAYASTAEAGLFNIVATGDSITTGYAPNRLSLAMQAQGVSGTGYSIASGGATASLYVGMQLDLNYKPEPAYHNQAVGAIAGPVYGFGPPWSYGSVIEPNPEPDAVIVMLGTNDAIQHAAGNYLAWPTYQTKMAEVFSYLSSAQTPEGKRPDIVIATPIPILAAQYAAANEFLTSTMIPWIEGQVAALQTQGLPVHLLDLNSRIQEQVDWQSWYGDGLHLYGANQAGYTWLATSVLNAVLDLHLGDANLDGVVDGLDYNAWADRYGQAGNWSQGDFNHDGLVDGLDYALWADRFGPGAEAFPNLAFVPEPFGITGLGGGLSTLVIITRLRPRVLRKR